MSDIDPHAVLTVAIERQNWELAALCILVIVAEAHAALPVDSADSLLDVLAPEPAPPPRRRRRCRDRRR